MGEGCKIRVGVLKLASCDGCQLVLLSQHEVLPALAGRFELLPFGLARSTVDDGARLDLALVEGSVSSEEQREALHAMRRRADRLVTLGACATSGGIQALRNWADATAYARTVYATPETVEALATSTAVADHVRVDFELRGCPIDGGQLVELLTAIAVGRRPNLRDEAVCAECKRAGKVCVAVVSDTPCLGPVTHAGCGALCPGLARGCYGCFGPREQANARALGDELRRRGATAADARRAFRLFTGAAAAFREESERHG